MSEKRAKHKDTSFVFVDIETTGFSPVKDKIIEIAFIKVVNGQEIDRFETLVNPEDTRISSYIQQMTGITPNSLDTAPTFKDISKHVQEFLKGSVFVAHNVNFDYGFIKCKLEELGIKYNSKRLCTVRMFKSFVPGLRRYGLDGMINYYGIDVTNRHRAMGDAEVLLTFWQTISKSFDKKVVEEKVKELITKPKLPPKILESDIEKLTNSPGVYVFYNSANMPIYVGKSTKVKMRVLSHFTNVTARVDQYIIKESYRIKHYQTVGEFGALILESKLVKQLKPIYNKQLREVKKLVAVIEIEKYDDYCQTKIVDLDTIHTDELSSVIGVFKSKQEAENFLIQKCEQYNLCEKLIGVQSGKGACFKYQINKCNGACIKKEDYIRYNIRFIQAFSGTKIEKWPYNGPIAINEKDGKQSETHIVNKWCYLGKIEDGEDINDLKLKDTQFNYDEYKILRKFLENNKVRVREVVLNN